MQLQLIIALELFLSIASLQVEFYNDRTSMTFNFLSLFYFLFYNFFTSAFCAFFGNLSCLFILLGLYDYCFDQGHSALKLKVVSHEKLADWHTSMDSLVINHDLKA